MSIVINSGHTFKKNVYVSISKRADNEIIQKVLKYLEQFAVKICYYEESIHNSYNIQDLKTIDTLVVIPPVDATAESGDPDKYIVDKGQREEATFFKYLNKSIYLVYSVSEGLYVKEVSNVEILNLNNFASPFRKCGAISTKTFSSEIINYSHDFTLKNNNSYAALAEGLEDLFDDKSVKKKYNNNRIAKTKPRFNQGLLNRYKFIS